VVVAAQPKILERSSLLRRAGVPRDFAVFAIDGEAWNLQTVDDSDVRFPWPRWALALIVVAAAFQLIHRRRRRRVGELVMRRPYLVLACAGVVWWLWLSPGWVGWLLIALGVSLAWRLTWPLPRVETRPRPSSSS
jgi:hypothetical protein